MITKFYDKVLSRPRVVLDFYAPWCVPCKSLAPILDRYSVTYTDRAIFASVNVDERPDMAEQFGIQNLPTLVFMKDGEEVFRHSGAWNAPEIGDAIKEYLEVE